VVELNKHSGERVKDVDLDRADGRVLAILAFIVTARPMVPRVFRSFIVRGIIGFVGRRTVDKYIPCEPNED
jgi:hypothetical protein